MSSTDSHTSDFFENTPQPILRPLAGGQVALFTAGCPGRETPGEDALAMVSTGNPLRIRPGQ